MRACIMCMCVPICAYTLCMCVPMCVCKCLPMMPMHATVESRGYGVSFCPLSLFTLSSWNSISQWIWRSPFWLCWHASVTLLVLPGLHPPSPGVWHHAQHYLLHRYRMVAGGGFGSELRPSCLSRRHPTLWAIFPAYCIDFVCAQTYLKEETSHRQFFCFQGHLHVLFNSNKIFEDLISGQAFQDLQVKTTFYNKYQMSIYNFLRLTTKTNIIVITALEFRFRIFRFYGINMNHFV